MLVSSVRAGSRQRQSQTERGVVNRNVSRASGTDKEFKNSGARPTEKGVMNMCEFHPSSQLLRPRTSPLPNFSGPQPSSLQPDYQTFKDQKFYFYPFDFL